MDASGRFGGTSCATLGRRARVVAFILAVAVSMSYPERSRAADLPEGRRIISLIAADGTRTEIGHVTFTPDGDASKIAVSLDGADFSNEFLSMRPFRCLVKGKEQWCHLEYPYDIADRVTATDLVDLEYRLMFIFKRPGGYGIDAWNGLYFKLALDEAGVVAGDAHEADFNVLASPPDAGTIRPIGHDALSEVAPATHSFARMEIR